MTARELKERSFESRHTLTERARRCEKIGLSVHYDVRLGRSTPAAILGKKLFESSQAETRRAQFESKARRLSKSETLHIAVQTHERGADVRGLTDKDVIANSVEPEDARLRGRCVKDQKLAEQIVLAGRPRHGCTSYFE